MKDNKLKNEGRSFPLQGEMSEGQKGSHKIGWLNLPGYKGETWNPIIGCSKVSAGCENCYALKMAIRIAGMERKKDVINYRAALLPDKNNKQTEWSGLTFLRKENLTKPASWKKPRLVFVCSMGDLFHESTSFEEINAVFSVMADNDQHIFIVLTKRPQRMVEFFEWKKDQHNILWLPKENIWLGVTAENQEQANKRIPKLLSVPAAVRFVSIEPMLGPVNLELGFDYGDEIEMNFLNGDYITNPRQEEYSHSDEKLDWIICGGESGHNARPMHPDWVSSVRDQCKDAVVPFFFKQWGEYQNGSRYDTKAKHIYLLDDGQSFDSTRGATFVDTKKVTSEYWNKHRAAVMAKVGRKQAGNLLDGERYEKYPEVES